MKIADIINEAPRDIKMLVLLSSGFSIDQIRNNSNKVKAQFKQSKTKSSAAAMKAFLSQLNFMLIEVTHLPQWETWEASADGKSVMREIERIYSDNTEFIQKYSIK